MKEILAKLVEGKDLTKEEAMKAQELILTGQATEAQIACFLTALRMKGKRWMRLRDWQPYCATRQIRSVRKWQIMWILSVPAETVPIRLIFPQHQRSSGSSRASGGKTWQSFHFF